MKNNKTKKCLKCNIRKSIENFYFHSDAKDKLRQFCIECYSMQSKYYRDKYTNINKNKTEQQIYDNSLKKCKFCDKEKLRNKENWHKCASNKDGLDSECKNCAHDKRLENVERFIYFHRYNAKRRNLEDPLTNEQLKEIMLKPCFYCGSYSKTKIDKFNGIDRVENSIGYILENCVSCCDRCNDTKSDSTFEQFEKIYLRWKEFRTKPLL